MPMMGIFSAMTVCLFAKFWITIVLGSRLVGTSRLTFIVHFGLRDPKLFFEIAVLNSIGSITGFGIAAVVAVRLALNED